MSYVFVPSSRLASPWCARAVLLILIAAGDGPAFASRPPAAVSGPRPAPAVSAVAAALDRPGVGQRERELAIRLADAHGGLARFLAATTIRYQHELVIPGDPGPPWRSVEAVDLSSGHVYQTWPNHGSTLGWDGRDTWTLDWKLDNPPKVMVYLNQVALLAPWQSATRDARLVAGIASLPGDPTLYQTLTVTFPDDPSRPPKAVYYKIFMDPASGRMRGLEYAVSFGRLLDLMGVDTGVNKVGPIIHLYDDWTTVEGLLLPTRYHTIGGDGVVYGRHEVGGWELDIPFDPAWRARPAGAVIDTSSHLRARPGG